MKKGKTSRIIFGVAFVIVFTVIVGTTVLDDTPAQPENQVTAEFQNVVNDIVLQSVIDREKFTESDNDVVTNFLDNIGLEGTEKFGIETQVAIESPDGSIETLSDIFAVSKLSVIDELGNIRNKDVIQTSFAGLSKTNDASVNIWATVKFMLDDDIIDTKRLWASTVKSQVTPLSIVSNLSFQNQDDDYVRIADIGTEKQKLQSEMTLWYDEITVYMQTNCTNCNGRDTEVKVREDKIELHEVQLTRLNVELAELNHRANVKIPVIPLSSDRAETFTFSLEDEGTSWENNSEHFYRVILTEVHANLDSDEDFKEFSWSGEYVAYEMKIIVDESVVVELDGDGNKIEIFKSDGTMSVNSITCSGWIGSVTGDRSNCRGYPSGDHDASLPTNYEFFIDGVSIGVVDNSYFESNRSSVTSCGGYPVQRCESISTGESHWNNPIIQGIPRNTDIVMKTGDGQIFEFTTPLTQQNMFIKCGVSVTSDNTFGCITNFGYES
jgi:hypothetical protein